MCVVCTMANYCYLHIWRVHSKQQIINFASSDDGSIIRDELAPKEEGHEDMCCLYRQIIVTCIYGGCILRNKV